MFDGLGTNIAVFSDVAESIDVCVFAADGNETRVEPPERTGSTFTGTCPISRRGVGTASGCTAGCGGARPRG
jgi:hypothetical protein